MNLKDALYILTESWNDVHKKAIVCSWKKLWPPMHISNNEEDWDPKDNLPLGELVEMIKRTKTTELTALDIKEWLGETAKIISWLMRK